MGQVTFVNASMVRMDEVKLRHSRSVLKLKLRGLQRRPRPAGTMLRPRGRRAHGSRVRHQ